MGEGKILDLDLVVKESSDVSQSWKILHLFFYAVVIVSGIGTGIVLGTVYDQFGDNCFLYSSLIYKNTNREDTSGNGSDVHIYYELDALYWGKYGTCQFCQFAPVTAAIFASFFSAFFLMCARGGYTSHGLPDAWRIVCPSVIFNIISFLVIVSAASVFSLGLKHMCSTLNDDSNVSDCRQLMLYDWEHLVSGSTQEMVDGQSVYRNLVICEILIWIDAFGWICASCVSLSRCFCGADFTLVRNEIQRPEAETKESGNSVPNADLVESQDLEKDILEEEEEIIQAK